MYLQMLRGKMVLRITYLQLTSLPLTKEQRNRKTYTSGKITRLWEVRMVMSS